MSDIDQAFCKRYDMSPRPPRGYPQVGEECNYLSYRDGWQDAEETYKATIAAHLAHDADRQRGLDRIRTESDRLWRLADELAASEGVNTAIRLQVLREAVVVFRRRLFLNYFGKLFAKPGAAHSGDDWAPAQPHGAAAGGDASAISSGAIGVTPSQASTAEAGLDEPGEAGMTRETDGR